MNAHRDRESQALALAAAAYLVILIVSASGLALALGGMYARAMPMVVVRGARQLVNAGSGVPGTPLQNILAVRAVKRLAGISVHAGPHRA